MKWLKGSAITVLTLAVLSLAGLGTAYWAVGTESGTNWLVRRLLAGAPQISIERIRGSLLDRLVLDGVRLRTARDELDIDSLTLEWDAPALLAGSLAFESGAAQRATYRRLPGTAGGGPPPELPWPLVLARASVTTLSINVADREYLITAASSKATYGGRRLELTDAAGTFAGAAVAGDAVFNLADGIALDVAGEWSGPIAGVAARGSLELTGRWPELTVRHELLAPFAATTTGTIETAPLRVDVVSEWQDLSWPSVTGLASPSGRLALAGSAAEYRYDGAGALDVAGRAAAFAVDGTGRWLELTLDRLELAPAAPGRGTLEAAGAVSLERRQANLVLSAYGLDPAWVAEAWPGQLGGTARLDATIAAETGLRLEAIDLAGDLRGYTVRIQGAASLTGRDRVRLDDLRLTSDANRVVLTGVLDRESVDLSLDAEVAKLDLLAPAAEGQLTADVHLSGRWQAPHAEGRVALRNASFAGVALERLDLSGAAGLAPDAKISLTLDSSGISRGALRVLELRASADGTAAAHGANVEVVAEGVGATLAATGGFADGVWRGSLERLDVDEPVLGPWRLEAPAGISVGRSVLTLATSCLLHTSNARWCAQLDLEGLPEDSVVVSGQNFDLATLRPVLPPSLELSGLYQLSGSLFDPMGRPRGAIAVTGGTTRARIAFGDEQAFSTELTRAQAGMTLTEGRLALTADLRSTGGGSAELRAEVADVDTRDSGVSGALHVEWPDLGFLALLSPDLGEVAGALAAELAVGGTVAAPTVDGRAAISNGRIVVPRWGLVVEGVEATATSPDGRSLAINATGNAGEGVLELAGTIELAPDEGWPTHLTLRGDAVRVVQRPEAEIYATPDLDVEVALPEIRVTGTVHVPRASLTLDALPAQAVTPSPDAVVHGERSVSQTRPLELRTAIELTLGDGVTYTGLSLDTTLSGGLRLVTEPGRSANATGSLRLAGTYDAYGQQLSLEDGQLLFSGPLDDPGLDVRAVRRFEAEAGGDATVVGIELTGTLQAPRTRVFSEPAMNEADALSYLLFGRPASGANAGLGTEETSTLQAAALSLGLQQALPVVQRIGDTLGLDELTVRSTATDAGALMAGKYLSPKLYIRYSYGLFNRIGGLLLRFRVNERLSVETRSGEQKSMDLLYTVEKD